MVKGGAAGKAAGGFLARAVADLLRVTAKDAEKGAAKRAARTVGKDTARAVDRDLARSMDNRVLCGDPIDVVTGEVVLRQVDIDLPGLLPLELSRTHLSSYRYGRHFGPSWSSSLDQRLVVDAAGVEYIGEDGMVLAYRRAPGGEVESLPEYGPRLRLTPGTEGYAVTDRERGRTLRFAPPPGGAGPWPLVSITNRIGHQISFDRDPDGLVREVRHSGGYRIAVDTAGGRVTRLSLRGHAAVELARFGYDAAGNLVTVTNSAESPLRFDYDDQHRLTRWTDRVGSWYGYHYDESGRVTGTSGSDGYLAGTLAHDPAARVTVVTDSLGHSTTYEYNELGQVVREVDPLGNTTHREWDRHHRPRSVTDPLGRTTRYAYDPNGDLVEVTRPDGLRASARYDHRGLPVLVTAPDGTRWAQEYDQRGNLTATTDPTGATTRYAYDQRGHLASVTDPLGGTRLFRTDAAGLTTATTDPGGGTTTYQRDAFGRVTAITDPLGGVVRMGWTVEGRPAWRVLADGATERWHYDAEGNQVEHVEPTGRVTRAEYGSFDLPRIRTEPDGTRLAFTYDTELRLTGVTDPRGLTWRYEYDPAGNLVRETDFDGRVLTYSYDAAGQLTERVNGAGQTTTYTRDQLGSIVEARSGDRVTRYSFDPLGRLLRAADGDTEVVITRDPLGRVLTETGAGRTVTSEYDAVGRRVRRRTPSGAFTEWEYGPGDRPVAMRTGAGSLRFDHDPAGREVARHLDAGGLITQAWDASHRPRAQAIHAGAGGAPWEAPRESRLVRGRSYAYRPDGYLSGVDDTLTGPRRFDLDPAGRITAVHGAGWVERYEYDQAGATTFADGPGADPAGRGRREYTGSRVRGAGAIRYEYDEQGRVVLRQRNRPSAGPDTWHYTWDADDQLTEVRTPDGQTWRYRYDPLGRRIAKLRMVDGELRERVEFTWDGTVLAEQTRADRAVVWDWEPGGVRPLTQTERVNVRDAPDEWIDERFYAIVTDLVGTATDLVTPDGELAWHRRAGLWGETAPVRPGEPDCPLRFAGQYHDEETGLDYNYHRYYDPVTGRYHSPDPLGLVPAPDPYGYVPNPTRWLDPLGLAPCTVAVLGRLPDTAVAKSWPGHEVLDVPDWTIAKNDAWVNSVVSRRMPVYLASPTTRANLWDSAAGRETVYARELRMFDQAGYTRHGDYLLPPGSP